MPQRAGSDKGALSTPVGAPHVTLPISGPSSNEAMGCRFVHTADVPFDSPRALRDPELADVIGGATREAFAAAIE
jgi:hypothetical protein